MTQQEMFPVAVLPLARTTDPATSQRAASELVGSAKLGQEQLAALCLVRAYPGKTANELARIAGYGDPRKVNRRLRELERVELVKDYGTTKDRVTNKECLRWWPIEVYRCMAPRNGDFDDAT